MIILPVRVRERVRERDRKKEKKKRERENKGGGEQINMRDRLKSVKKGLKKFTNYILEKSNLKRKKMNKILEIKNKLCLNRNM